MIEQYKEYLKMLLNIDWYYAYSDDRAAYKRGEKQVDALKDEKEPWKQVMQRYFSNCRITLAEEWENNHCGKNPIGYVTGAHKRLNEIKDSVVDAWVEVGHFVCDHFISKIEGNIAWGVKREDVELASEVVMYALEQYKKEFENVDLEKFVRQHSNVIGKTYGPGRYPFAVSKDYIAISPELDTRLTAIAVMVERLGVNTFKTMTACKEYAHIDDALTVYSGMHHDYGVIQCPPHLMETASDLTNRTVIRLERLCVIV